MATTEVVKAKDDPRRAEWLRNIERRWLRHNPEMKLLKEKLLSLSGDFVVPNNEPDLKELLERGRVFSTDSVKLHEMRGSQCHKNVARLFSFSFKGETIATGWALSDDGLWRQHSWPITSEGEIVETIEVRLMYYGVKLTKEESKMFCFREESNL